MTTENGGLEDVMSGHGSGHLSGNVRTSADASQNLRNEPTDAELELSPRQLKAIDLLLRGVSFAKAARRLRVDPRTIYRWRHDRIFLSELHRRASLPPSPLYSGERAGERGERRSNSNSRATARHAPAKPRDPEPFWKRAARMTTEELERELARTIR